MDNNSQALIRANLGVINLAVIILATQVLNRNNRKYKKSIWVRNIFRKRKEQGCFSNLIREMRESDLDSHFRFFRMTPGQFNEILTLIKDRISKNDTVMRKCISAEERLALTLRFLASGDMQVSMSFAFRLGRTTVSNIIKETCAAIWDIMSLSYVKFPESKNDWLEIAKGFEKTWNLPHCLGALDGKHVVIECPSNSGSKFFNYKGTFSIILMALCDSNYVFRMVDIGSFGSQSDGGVFSKTSFGARVQTNPASLNIPHSSPLVNSQINFPYFFVGDEAFPLLENLLRPYPGKDLSHEKKIFNYRLSRARRIIENTFGIMAARWRIFRKPIKGKCENIDQIVKACIVLHNFLMTHETNTLSHKRRYKPPNFADTEDANGNIIGGGWRNIVAGGNAIRVGGVRGANRHGAQPAELRNTLASYLCNEGAVEWQDAYVNRGNINT